MEGCRGVQKGGKLQTVNLASRSPVLPARGWSQDERPDRSPLPALSPHPEPGCGAERASPGVCDVPIVEPGQWQNFSAAKKHLFRCEMRSWDFNFFFFFKKRKPNRIYFLLPSFQLVEI